MYSNFLFDNLTIFSVLRIIFVHRSYRVLHLYPVSTTDLGNDFSTKISQLSNKQMIPITVTSIDQIPTNRSECEEPVLNVVLVNNLSFTGELHQLNKHLRPNEMNIVLLTSYNTTVDQVNLKPVMELHKKFIIMSNRFIASIDQFHFDRIYSIPLQPFDMNSTKRFIYNLSAGKMNGTTMNIFMQHLPPKSSVTANIGGEIFAGPDGRLSELLMKFLNATPNYWSDIGLMYPKYKDWAKDPLVASRLYYRDYHSEVLTSNLISSFNRTWVLFCLAFNNLKLIVA